MNNRNQTNQAGAAERNGVERAFEPIAEGERDIGPYVDAETGEFRAGIDDGDDDPDRLPATRMASEDYAQTTSQGDAGRALEEKGRAHPHVTVPSLNYHIWEPCNMRCRFCFATFQDVKTILPKGHLDGRRATDLVDQLCGFGFEKINFAGGEPTLCPWLPDLICRAKEHGLTTSIVTNGSKLSTAYLARLSGILDWIAVSIDSVDPDTLSAIGRARRSGGAMSEDEYIDVADEIKRHGMRLKVNTVVNRLNHKEDLRAFIQRAKPERWKIFQALAVEGQNDQHIADLAVTQEQFAVYLERNKDVGRVEVVPESNELMTGSYVMVDPAGRFFDNTNGKHTYSRPILEAGVAAALNDVNVYADRFAARKGLYDW